MKVVEKQIVTLNHMGKLVGAGQTQSNPVKVICDVRRVMSSRAQTQVAALATGRRLAGPTLAPPRISWS
jgi:hypothetical protein